VRTPGDEDIEMALLVIIAVAFVAALALLLKIMGIP
jgi:hypothetical protein